MDGQLKLSADAVATTASHAVEVVVGQVPAFTCSVKQAGSYLVGGYPDPDYRAGVGETIYNNLTSLVSCCCCTACVWSHLQSLATVASA